MKQSIQKNRDLAVQYGSCTAATTALLSMITLGTFGCDGGAGIGIASAIAFGAGSGVATGLDAKPSEACYAGLFGTAAGIATFFYPVQSLFVAGTTVSAVTAHAAAQDATREHSKKLRDCSFPW